MTDRPSPRWTPIRDYERPPASYARPALRALAAIWTEQRAALEANAGFRPFQERLRREWAIETGLIERIYTLDRGVTTMLIEQGIDAARLGKLGGGQDAASVVAILEDHQDAIDGLFAFVKGDRQLTPGYLKELHAQLTRHQERTTALDQFGRTLDIPLLRGAFKIRPNNPRRPDGALHEYCPPEHVDAEVEQLVRLHAAHGAVPTEVEAAWLHHRFTQIHPFQDGNGRVARCLSTLVLLKAGWFPLVIRDTPHERGAYIAALEAADRGDLDPLVGTFAAAQTRAFVQALGIAAEVASPAGADGAVAATRAFLEQREGSRLAAWQRTRDIAVLLQALAATRLDELARSLRDATGPYLPGAEFAVDAAPERDERSRWFRQQVDETARQLGYWANAGEPRAWLRLRLRTDRQAEILVSFHGSGRQYRGVMAASACVFRREQTERDAHEVLGVTPLSTEIFQFNYRDDPSSVGGRFRTWLEAALTRGLETWRAGL